MTPLILFALGWAAGIWAAAQLALPAWAWPGAAGLAGVGLIAFRRRAPARTLLVCALAFALGAWRHRSAQPAFDDPGFVAAHNGRADVTLEGVVWDEPDVRDTRTNLRVRAATLAWPGAQTPIPVQGLVLVSAPRYSEERLTAAGAPEWRYGDRIRVTGALETPPEEADFSYRDYLARLGIHAQLRGGSVEFLAERQGQWVFQRVFDFKRRALATLARLFPEPHAALLSGILLGVESGIPAEIKDAFSATGTSHIVAISGFNIAILVSLFMAAFRRALGANRGAALTLVVIAAYTVLVGAGASVVRAAIMGSLGVVAQRLGRRAGGLNALAAAAVAMTAVNPLTLWDVGFQLSAAATLGLILYGDRFQDAFQAWLARRLPARRAERLANLAGELFLITLAAQVTTLPLLAYYFRSVSLISLPANMVILPVQPAVMILGGLALILGLLWFPLGQLAAWLTWPLTAYTLAFVDLFARVPGGALGLSDVAPALVVGFYAALFALTWMLSRPADRRPTWWARFASESLPAGGAAGLALCALLAWSAAFSLPEAPGRLRVTVLDVGSGDAVLIQTPGGGHILVDGGPSGGALVRGLSRHLPLFHNRLDLLVVAGARDENVGGLPDVLARYGVDQALVTQSAGKGAAFETALQALNTRPVRKASAADLPAYDLGDGVRLWVLADGPGGAALRLEWGAFALVMPVGLEAEDEARLLARTPVAGATALLATERGARTALTDEWVQALDPQVVVASVGAGRAGDIFGPELLGRLAGRTLLRTDERGAVTLVSDGRQLWVETQR